MFVEEIPHALDPSRNKFIVANNDVVLCAQFSPLQIPRFCTKG